MSHEIIMRRKGDGLEAVDPLSQSILASIPFGEYIKVKLSRPRHAEHHRKFFALMQEIFENQTKYPTFEGFIDAFKIAIGHYDEKKIDSRTVIILRSISFDKMDQISFEQFYAKAVEFILAKVIPAMNKQDLDQRIQEILLGRNNV